MQENRAFVRLDHIRENARFFLKRAEGAKLCAVVKADAYGHGAAAVAQALSGIADVFAVSLIEEGAQLRHAGIAEDILVLSPPLCESEVLRGAHHGLIFTVSDAADYALIANTCEKYDLCARCHIKVNTGMNRYGFDYLQFERFLSEKLSERIFVEGIYSHFYMPEDEHKTREQFLLFERFCSLARRAFGKLTCHVAATGGVLASDRYALDMVRVGIGLYGYLPAAFSLPEGSIKPALSVYSSVAAGRLYSFGGAGYGEYRPKSKELCVIRTGYADGFFRQNVRGAGNHLCMDACVAEVSLKKYEEVCVFSDADAYAKAHGTISYEALVNVCGRAVKEYVNG